MTDFALYNPTYRQLEESFKAWLTLLQHHHTTIENSPVRIREFLHWLEDQKVTSVTKLTEKHLEGYMDYLSHRKNKRRPGGLSTNYLNKNISSLKQFSEYLRQTKGQGFTVDLPYYKPVRVREILTVREVQAMYEATRPDVIGLRDRAILGIYYGCGLRRAEGAALDLNDFLADRKLLYVRKGKNYKERYVPVADRVFDDLMEYIELGRSHHAGHSPALLLSRYRKRASDILLIKRVQHLKEQAGITKQIGLHTLRHSIATHLLQQGMKLAEISRFLGHQSIETTQIYTHVAYEACATAKAYGDMRLAKEDLMHV